MKHLHVRSIKCIPQHFCSIPPLPLVLFAVLAASACSSLVPYAYNHVHHRPVVAPLQPCRDLFIADPSPQLVKQFTQLHMQLVTAGRQRWHTDMVLKHRQATRTENTTNAVQDAVYGSSLSDAQLQALSSAASTEAAAAEQGLQALVNQMVDANIIRQTAEVNGVLAGCLVSRLDAAHYPEKVKVSFTMQYYKQPSFQHKMVQSILNCNKSVPIELLVNVDHPQASWMRQDGR